MKLFEGKGDDVMAMIPLMNVDRQAKSLDSELVSRVAATISSGKYILGKEVEYFENKFAEYCECQYGVGVGNGTDALTIALKALGIGLGDEVITSAMSFFATPEAIARVGATPVFVDCTKDTFTLDPLHIEEHITSRTKAIIPVHLYGQCADMERINKIAKKYHLYVIEDCAQAAGAKIDDKMAGSMGDISCISFFPTKNLGGAGDGGMILTKNKDLYRKCRAFRVHGSGADGQYTYNSLIKDKNKVDLSANPTKYNNYMIGFNSRLDELQAAILNVKLPYLDKWNNIRNAIADRYNREITNINVEKPLVGKNNYHVYYVYVLLVKSQQKFREYLKEKGITTGVYFPIPLYKQSAFAELQYTEGEFQNADYVAEHSVAIPMFPELEKTEIDYIIDTINSYEED